MTKPNPTKGGKPGRNVKSVERVRDHIREIKAAYGPLDAKDFWQHRDPLITRGKAESTFYKKVLEVLWLDSVRDHIRETQAANLGLAPSEIYAKLDPAIAHDPTTAKGLHHGKFDKQYFETIYLDFVRHHIRSLLAADPTVRRGQLYEKRDRSITGDMSQAIFEELADAVFEERETTPTI